MTSRTEVETQLRARTRQLSRPVHSKRDQGADHLLVAVGAVRLAIPLTALRQTVAPGPVTRLPGLPPELLGIRSLRGDLVCLADTAALLGSTRAAEPESQHVVVMEDASPLGLLVDEVLGLRHVNPADVHPPPAAGTTVTALPVVLAGVTADGTLLVETAALLADPRLRLSTSPAPDEG